MIKLLSGGHYVKDGYCYKIYMTLPEFVNEKTVNLLKKEHKFTNISFPTKFCLTRNSIYCNIVIRVFGFGLGLEIQSKS